MLTAFVVSLILALAVLLASYMFLRPAKSSVDIMQAQSALRQCCSDRGIWDCMAAESSIWCKVPWDPPSETLYDLKIQANVTDLQLFCNCHT